MKAWLDAIRKLNEAFYTSVEVRSEYYNGLVDIFENPTPAELGKLMREHGQLRGFFDGRNDRVYVWDAAVLHHEIEVDGEAWLEVSKEDVWLQIYAETAAEFWFPENENGIELEEIEAKVRESRSMQPLLRNRKLVVRWR